MELIFLGYNDVGLDIYEWLCDREGVSVEALVTKKEQLDLVSRLQPDLLVSVGYDHLVPAETLAVPQRGAINLHPSYLPYNRGKSPNVWSIVEGTPAGVTLHFMDPSFDTGDIIKRRSIETSFADTGKSVFERLELAQFDLFTDIWPDIEKGNVSTTAQSSSEGNYHSVDNFKQLCEIDPTAEYEAKTLFNRLRAVTFPPFDNAFVDVDGERYYLDLSVRHETESTASPDGRLSTYE